MYRGKYKAINQKYKDEIYEIQSAFTNFLTTQRPKLTFVLADDARNERILTGSQMSV